LRVLDVFREKDPTIELLRLILALLNFTDKEQNKIIEEFKQKLVKKGAFHKLFK